MKIEDYLKGNNIEKFRKKIFCVDVLCVSLIYNNGLYLEQKVTNKWNLIIDREINKDDIEFIHDLFNSRPYSIYKNCNKLGINDIDKIENKQDFLDIARRLWFYLFISKNSESLKNNDILSIVEETENREIDNDFKDIADKYYIKSIVKALFKNIKIKELASFINDNLIKDLEASYKKVLKSLETYCDGKYCDFKKIYSLSKDDYEIKEIVKEKGNPKNNDEAVKSAKEEKTETKNVSNEISKNEEPKNIYESAILCINKAFEDHIKLKDENLFLQNRNKKLEAELKLNKITMYDKVFSELNSDEYGNLIDYLYNVKNTKDSDPELLHVANIVLSFIKDKGYVFLGEDKINTEVKGKSEELVNFYRWNIFDDITDKDMIVVSPGLKAISKQNRKIYLPKISIKKNEE